LWIVILNYSFLDTCELWKWSTGKRVVLVWLLRKKWLKNGGILKKINFLISPLFWVFIFSYGGNKSVK
jgi:hypothetical protein